MDRFVRLKDGALMPKLGQGTWFLGEDKSKEQDEIKSIKIGIENNMTLIDTAEMYGEGLAEELVGKAIKGYDREKLFLVSKVYPHNAGRRNIFRSCENTLKRMGVEYLDLYLLHWRGAVPLSETVECMEELVKKGRIKRWGVSNFDIDDMKELMTVKDGDKCVVNQVLYHLGSRGIEYSLYPWMKEHNIPVMAYCPMAQGASLKHELMTNKELIKIAEKYDLSIPELLLAFVLQKDNIIAIPRTSNPQHALRNAKVADVKIDEGDLEIMDREFPAPDRKVYLDIV